MPYNIKNLRKILSLSTLKSIGKFTQHPTLSRTYYSQEVRKNKLAIWLDNIKWIAKNGEINQYYYVYGLDRKNTIKDSEIMPYNEFKKIRDSKNLRPNNKGYNYVSILRDKFIFAQFLTSLRIPTPVNIAILNQNEIIWLVDNNRTSLDAIIKSEIDISGFCKELEGILGKGAFPLKIKGGKLYVKEEEISLTELKAKLTDQYLLQDQIIQHYKLSELHPDSVNTIRLITFNNKGSIEVFCASLRIGADGKNVDNWASGGIVVGIDLDSGKLNGEGFFKPGYGGRVWQHPNTGITLDGFEIPFFHAGVEMVCKLHSYLYGIHSVGWDIAITPNGPTIIEGNDNWEGGIPMLLEKNFRSRFLKFYSTY